MRAILPAWDLACARSRVPGYAPRVEKIRLRARELELSCPLCREDLVEPVYACPACETVFHAGCARQLGGCSTLGCVKQGKPAFQDPFRGGRQRRRAVWRLLVTGLMAGLPGAFLSGGYAHLLGVWQRESAPHRARVQQTWKDEQALRRGLVERLRGELLEGLATPRAHDAARAARVAALQAVLEAARPGAGSEREAELVARAAAAPDEVLPAAVGLHALDAVREAARSRAYLRPPLGLALRAPWRAAIERASAARAAAGRPVSGEELRAWIRAALTDDGPVEQVARELERPPTR